MKIAVFGAGAYGATLGGILSEGGHEVEYYDPKMFQNSLDDVLNGASYMVLAIPSVAVHDFLPILPKDKTLIVATKGILTDSDFNDFSDWAVLSGPGFASDISQHKETFLTATDKRVAEIFDANYLIFDFTDDKLGVLMCGALKNVYALMAGLLGIEAGSEPWEEYIKTVSNEMKSILSTNGADSKTVDLSCGIGDLRLTCNYPSRNYEFGQKLRLDKKAKPEKTVEGLTALQKICNSEILVPKDAKILQDLMDRSKEWS